MEDSTHKILPYNSDLEPLRMPEYGRNIQILIDKCLEIEDKAERTAFAKEIAQAMAALVPENVGEKKDMKKIWDQMMILSDFRLDVDFPCDVITKEELTPEAAPIPYYAGKKICRHYGRLVESMIEVICEMPGGEEKDRLINLVANQMKKNLIFHNPEGVSDRRVINDLNTLSKGRLAIDPVNYTLLDFAAEEIEATAKKKKKKQIKYRSGF